MCEDHIDIRGDKNEKAQQVFFVSTKVNRFINGLTMLEKQSSGWEISEIVKEQVTKIVNHETTILGLQMVVKKPVKKNM